MMHYVSWTQQDRSDCGIVCLASLLQFYGKQVSLKQLRCLAGTNQSGTSLYGLQQAARKLGFDAEGVQASLSYLDEIKTPVLAHQKMPEGYGHFVVIVEVMGRYVRIMDPAKGKVLKVRKSEFIGHWEGVLLLVSSRGKNVKQKPDRREVESVNQSLEKLGLNHIRLWGVPYGILLSLGLIFWYSGNYKYSGEITDQYGLSFILLGIAITDFFFDYLHRNKMSSILRIEIQEYKLLVQTLLRQSGELVDSWGIHELANRFEDIRECKAYLKERALLIPKNCLLLATSLVMIKITLNHLVLPYVTLCLAALITLIVTRIPGSFKEIRREGMMQSLSVFVLKQKPTGLRTSWQEFLRRLKELEKQLVFLNELAAMRSLLFSVLLLFLFVFLFAFPHYLNAHLSPLVPLFLLVLWSGIRIKEISLHVTRKKSYTKRRKRWEDLRYEGKKTT